MACSTEYTVLQQTLIQKYNQWTTAFNTLHNENSQDAARTEANNNISRYYQELTESFNCMFNYLESHKVNPPQDYNQLRNTYYNVIVPMRKQLENSRNEAQNLYGHGDVEDHLFETEKQNYNATVYIYIMLTVLATVLLYYVLLNIDR